MLKPEEIIRKKKEYFYPNAMHFYKKPPHIVKGEGKFLIDEEGKRYRDFFAGVTVVNCGHCNQEINRNLHKQLDTLQHVSVIYLTEPVVNLAEKLADFLPGKIKNTFFCNSGTEANEGALLLARMHTKKKKFISFEGGLHGRSHLTMSVTGIPMWRIDPFLSEDVYFAKGFMTSEDKDRYQASQESLESVEKILKEHGDEIAACIIEPMQGNGGMNIPATDFFEKLKSILQEYEVLLIADEVQTGFGRTGKKFAVDHFNVEPDIITYAKALGNGIPIGGFSTNPEIAKSFNKPSASTLGGNPVSMQAGLGVLDYIERNKLWEHSYNMGEYLQYKLIRIKEEFDFIKDVRGLGLMIGIEIDNPERVDYVLEEMKDKGFIVGKNGINRNVIALQPPLIIDKEDINLLCVGFEEVFKKIK